MRRTWITILSLLAVFCLMTSTAFAVVIIKGVNISGGTSSTTTSATTSTSSSASFAALSAAATSCAGTATTLSVCASIAGLGKTDATVNVDASGIATALCVAPGGGTLPPGHNPKVTAFGSEAIPQSIIKNGRAKFSVSTSSPSTTETVCPNQNWKLVITSVFFSFVKITVVQGGVPVAQACYSHEASNWVEVSCV